MLKKKIYVCIKIYIHINICMYLFKYFISSILVNLLVLFFVNTAFF